MINWLRADDSLHLAESVCAHADLNLNEDVSVLFRTVLNHNDTTLTTFGWST
jgi:hypothetical protein